MATANLIGIGWGFDCMGYRVQHLMDANPTAIWPYISGDGGVKWTDAEIWHFAPKAWVIRVNQGYGQSPAEALNGDEFDVESGAWSISQVGQIVAARRKVSWSTRLYATWDNYGRIKQELAQKGIGRSVYFRIADWNLDQHLAQLELHDDVYAGQWASPATNPVTRVPGLDITLAEAGADLNVVLHTYTGWAG